MGKLYTFAPPAGWEDVTSSTSTLPEMQQLMQGLRDKGATGIDISVYQSKANDNVMVLSASFTPDTPSEAQLDGFDRGARGSYTAHASETAFKIDKTATMHVSTQRVMSKDTSMTALRYVGFTQDDAMATVTANCTGADSACDAILAQLHVDPSQFRALSSLPQSNVAYRMGVIVGSLLIAALLGAYFLRRRSLAHR